MNRTVKTENGLVRGLAAGYTTITSFKGIPFAAPPVGDLRWRVPQPAENWEGVRDCYTFAPACMQQRNHKDFENMWIREFYIDDDVEMSEDCLYLNVWTPSKTFDDKLPVVVWYYGGGMQSGYTSEMEFNGEFMARRGVVFVSVAYRVNVFGYLAHPEITAEGKANGEGYANFGLHDQRAATAWVRRNIAAFGGDPEKITIMGQSAGGRSVLFHATSRYTEKGDFARIISQSGGGIPFSSNHYNYPTLEEVEENGVKFFEHLGVKNLAEARKVDAETLRQAGLSFKGIRWGVAVDRDFVPDHPLKLLTGGKFQQVPIMCGYVGQDMGGMQAFKNEDEIHAYLADLFGEDGEKIFDLAKKDSADFAELNDKICVNGQRFGNELLAKRVYDCGLPAYLYCFDSDMPGDDNVGAFHSSELWFTFETLRFCWRPFEGRHYDLARKVCNYWTNFIKSGDPNGNDHDGTPMPRWEKYTEDAPYGMYLAGIPHMKEEKPAPVEDAMLSLSADKLWRK